MELLQERLEKIREAESLGLFKDLENAKENTRRLLEHPSGLVDFHGLTYRAWEVERIREKLKTL